jgi:hypothetical protein
MSILDQADSSCPTTEFPLFNRSLLTTTVRIIDRNCDFLAPGSGH